MVNFEPHRETTVVDDGNKVTARCDRLDPNQETALADDQDSLTTAGGADLSDPAGWPGAADEHDLIDACVAAVGIHLRDGHWQPWDILSVILYLDLRRESGLRALKRRGDVTRARYRDIYRRFMARVLDAAVARGVCQRQGSGRATEVRRSGRDQPDPAPAAGVDAAVAAAWTAGLKALASGTWRRRFGGPMRAAAAAALAAPDGGGGPPPPVVVQAVVTGAIKELLESGMVEVKSDDAHVAYRLGRSIRARMSPANAHGGRTAGSVQQPPPVTARPAKAPDRCGN